MSFRNEYQGSLIIVQLNGALFNSYYYFLSLVQALFALKS